MLLALFAACTQSTDSLLSEDNGASGSITRFTVFNGFMYALNLNEIKTYSLSNPDKPELVSTLTTDYGLETIIIYDNTIYVGARASLYILDIADPAVPKLLSKTERVQGEQLFSGCDPVVVKDNHAYSTVKIVERVCGTNSIVNSALVVWNVSDKTNPVLETMYFLSEPNGLGYRGDYLFVCDEGSDKVEVFNIKNTPDLEQTAYGFPVTDPIDVIVNGDKMIVSTRTSFEVYEIGDITQIKRIAVIEK